MNRRSFMSGAVACVAAAFLPSTSVNAYDGPVIYLTCHPVVDGVRVLSGEILCETAVSLWQAQEMMRHPCFALPFGYRRELYAYAVSSDGRKIEFEVRDREIPQC